MKRALTLSLASLLISSLLGWAGLLPLLGRPGARAEDHPPVFHPILPHSVAGPVGRWGPGGYCLMDREYSIPLSEGVLWMTADTTGLISVKPSPTGVIRKFEIIWWEIFRLPWGWRLTFLLNMYPGVWYAAEDGVIYGDR